MNPEVILRPKVLLRVEGAVALGLALIAYAAIGKSWWLFILLFLVPDVALLAYFANPRVLAVAYNTMHTYLLPGGLFALGFITGRGTPMAVALIWIAHIGIDRVLGFGLKYGDASPKESHLQRL